MRKQLFYLSLCLFLSSAPQLALAQYPNGQSTKRLATDSNQCPAELGAIEVDADVFGAIGSSVNSGGRHHFDPFNDSFNQGFVQTVFEWMSFLCVTPEGASANGTWLENGSLNTPVTIREENGQVFSEFTTNGVRVNLRYELQCTEIQYCYQFTNVGAQRLQNVSITPYLDGDLYFGDGGLGNDFGATSLGMRKQLWEFDAGDNPAMPSTFVGIYGLGMADRLLQSWEIGSYSNQRTRIATISGGSCTTLRNDINRSESNIDLNQDLITDSGFDVTLALRYDAGAIDVGATSPEICYAIKWGVGLPCSDEDLDLICLPDDNCPATVNPDQSDIDMDGVGDVCDPCPNLANEGGDSDGDGVGDRCDLCPNVVNIEQNDSDMDGIGDICDPCPQLAGNGGGDDDQDGLGNECDNCPRVANPDQSDRNGDGFGDLCCSDTEQCDNLDNDCDGNIDEGLNDNPVSCATGQRGVCAMGLRLCQSGQISCQPQVMAMDEMSCDGIDENCNGQIDEGLRNACGYCGTLPQESCNGIDDNCNGQVDDGELCPEGLTCYAGSCVNRCQSNECLSPLICQDGLCLAQCQISGCEVGFRCQPTSGACESECMVSCQAGEICYQGNCLPDNCYSRGCDMGLACINGACVTDPCAGVICGDQEFCRDGSCVGSCALISCGFEETCVDGNCISLQCGESHIVCAQGELCQNGACVPDPCTSMNCQAGEACLNGICQGNPCVNIDCPAGAQCQVIQGAIQCVMGEIEQPGNHAQGGEQAGSMAGTQGGSVAGNTSQGGSMAGSNAGTGIMIGATQAGGSGSTGVTVSSPKDSGCQTKQNQDLGWLVLFLLMIISKRERLKVNTAKRSW